MPESAAVSEDADPRCDDHRHGRGARRRAVHRRHPRRRRPHHGRRTCPRRPAADATVIDGRDRLVMPGLVNGHLHSSEQFFKGRYERMPLEVWLLYAYPLLMGPPIPERLLYLRSLLVAIELLKGGVTTICDCFFDPPKPVPGAARRRLLGLRGCRRPRQRHQLDHQHPRPRHAALCARRSCRTSYRRSSTAAPSLTAAAYADYCEAASPPSTSGQSGFAICSRRRGRSAARWTCSSLP